MKTRSRHVVLLALIGALPVSCRRAAPEADFAAPVIYRFGERTACVLADPGWNRLRPATPGAVRFLQEGWDAEPGEVDGVHGRWIVRERAGIRFVIFDTDHVELQFRLKPYTRSYRGQKLSLFVNDVLVGARSLDRGAWQDVTFFVPPEALRRGVNGMKLTFTYASRRRGQAAFVESIALRGPAPAGRAVAEAIGEIGWKQTGNSVVRWRLVVPRRGYLRVRASSKEKEAGCRVRLLAEDRAVDLLDGPPPAEQTLFSLAAFGGERAELEFTAMGNEPLEWTVCEAGGHIDPADVNVYLITIDSLRADHVGFMRETANPDSATPFLDELAKRGVVFRRTWAASNESLPSFASILTGRYPQSHGLIKNGRALDARQWSLSRLLGKAGFRTAVYANFGILTWGKTTGKDFEKRRAILGTPPTLDMSDTRGNVFAAALNWTTVLWRERQFLWLHSQFLHMDPLPAAWMAPIMEPLKRTYGDEAAEAAAERMNQLGFKQVSQEYTAGRMDLSEVELEYWRAHYRAAVRFSDDHVRAFWEGLKRTGLDPYALTVVVSDHGASQGERRRLLHTGPPYDHLLHVPLLLILPGYDARNGTTIDSLAEAVDIAPTMMDYFGLRVPRRMQGTSLLPQIRGDASAGKEYCFAMVGRTPTTHYYAVRDEEWAYWSDFGKRSFLERLPPSGGSVECVAKQHPEQAERLEAKLAGWVGRTIDVSVGAQDELSDRVREILKKAGYLENRE